MKPIAVLLHSRKFRLTLVISGILFLLAAVCLVQACLRPLSEGITLGGVEIGGMTPVQARKALTTALEESLYSQNLIVQLPEETLTFSPEESGVKVSIGKAIFSARHSAPSANLNLESWLKLDSAAIRGKLEKYAAQYDTVLTQPTVTLEGTAPDLSTEHFQSEQKGQILVLTLGTPELHLDVEAVLSEILHAFSEAVILCEKETYRLEPEVLPDALPQAPDIAGICEAYTCAPVNDSLDRDTFDVIYGTYGTAVPENALTEQLLEAESGDIIRIPLLYLPPELMGQDVFFQDVLGSYETRHTDNKNRNANLQLQCDAINGLILQPGETFSMNGTLGERTTERGYLPAPGYSGNRLVNTPGGGVCQGTTTLYNCVLLADLEVVTRFCHGARVGYVPLGLDAAVNWLTTDFEFRNNFNFPVQLRAWLEDGYVKMQILGTDEKDYYIKMETGKGEDEYAYYARSYKCKYSKETDELLSRDVEAFSTYYKSVE